MQCLYYAEPGFSSRTYGVYLNNSQSSAKTEAALARRSNDQNILRNGLSKVEAIAAARKFVNQGVCAEAKAMANPLDL